MGKAGGIGNPINEKLSVLPLSENAY